MLWNNNLRYSPPGPYWAPGFSHGTSSHSSSVYFASSRSDTARGKEAFVVLKASPTKGPERAQDEWFQRIHSDSEPVFPSLRTSFTEVPRLTGTEEWREVWQAGPLKRCPAPCLIVLHPGEVGAGMVELQTGLRGSGAKGVYYYFPMGIWGVRSLPSVHCTQQEAGATTENGFVGCGLMDLQQPHRISKCFQTKKGGCTKLDSRASWEKRGESNRGGPELRKGTEVTGRVWSKEGRECCASKQMQPSARPPSTGCPSQSPLELRLSLKEKEDPELIEMKFLSPDRMKANMWIQSKKK